MLKQEAILVGPDSPLLPASIQRRVKAAVNAFI